MDSWMKREVTRLRRRACRWAEERERFRYVALPPAIVVGGVNEGRAVVDVEGMLGFLGSFRLTLQKIEDALARGFHSATPRFLDNPNLPTLKGQILMGILECYICAHQLFKKHRNVFGFISHQLCAIKTFVLNRPATANIAASKSSYHHQEEAIES